MQLEQHIPDIIHNGITYIDFLTMDEEQLQGLTFLLPYERRVRDNDFISTKLSLFTCHLSKIILELYYLIYVTCVIFQIIIQHLKLFHTRPWTKQSIHKPAKGDKFK